VTNFPSPEQPEALAVPGNDGFRFDDDERRSPVAPELLQPGPEVSIRGSVFWALHRALQNGKLMPQSENLGLKGNAAAEEGPEGREQGREYAGGRRPGNEVNSHYINQIVVSGNDKLSPTTSVPAAAPFDYKDCCIFGASKIKFCNLRSHRFALTGIA